MNKDIEELSKIVPEDGFWDTVDEKLKGYFEDLETWKDGCEEAAEDNDWGGLMDVAANMEDTLEKVKEIADYLESMKNLAEGGKKAKK